MVAKVYHTSVTCCILCWLTAVSGMGEVFGGMSGWSPRAPARECNVCPTFEPYCPGLVITASMSRFTPSVSRDLGSVAPRKKRDVECSLDRGLSLRFIALATSFLRCLMIGKLSDDNCLASPTCVGRFSPKSSLCTWGKGEDKTLACQFSTRSRISRRSNTGAGGRG
jgi:hypothetical protein